MSRFFLPVILGLCIWAYFPALGGGFIFDDETNISANEFLKIDRFSLDGLWQASMSSHSGPLKRPVTMLSFAVNHVFTAMNPWWMKVTNLAIHLFNGLLVLLVVRKLTHQCNDDSRAETRLLPYFAMGIWLLHPINVTAVAYIVQRMTSLSSTFLLLAIYCYLLLRQEKLINWRAYLLSFSILVFWLLGLFSKEVAILLSIYIFLLEWCVYGFHTNSNAEKNNLLLLWTLLAIPWAGAFIYVIYDPAFILSGYESQPFSLSQRVLTEFRVVADYLRLTIIPDTRDMGLYHDDIVLSRTLFSPISTLLTLLLILTLSGLALYSRKKAPLFCLGILWFVGGHLLESTVYPLEIKYLHRNYLPSLGIILAALDIGFRLFKNYRSLLTIVAILFMLGFSVSTRSLSHQWSADFRMHLLEAMNNPDSPRANFRAGQVLKTYAIFTGPGEKGDEYRKMAIEYFARIRELNADNIGGEMAILETYLQTGQPPPQAIIDSLIGDFARAKFDIGMLRLFDSYKKCFIEGECLLGSDDFDRMKNAISVNSEMEDYYKRSLLIMYAEYLADYKEDIDKAINTIVEALIVYPTLDDLMLLTLYYERGDYYKEMGDTLGVLEHTDKYGVYRKFIKETRLRMAKLSNPH